MSTAVVGPRGPNDTAWWVTKQLYPCKVRSFDMMSADYIAYMGLPDSGDEFTNQEMRNEWTDVRITIGRMAEYLDEGVPVRLPSDQTTKEIYDRIIAHLAAVREAGRDNPHPLRVPIDDLIKLDRFASTLFPHAKPYFPKENHGFALSQAISGLLKINKTSAMQNAGMESKEEADVVAEVKHESFADAFMPMKRRANNNFPKWKKK